MITRRQKRKAEDNTLPFLDVISCSFGAIVLLLLIIKTTAPEPTEEDLMMDAKQQAYLETLQSQQEDIDKALQEKERELEEQRQRLAQLMKQRNKDKQAKDDSGSAAVVREKLKGQLHAALQTLDAEIRALKSKHNPSKVGGIPADSRHIIFIIDTSGSMHSYAWPKVREQMAAILDAYPQIDGIQVLNDNGEHLFKGYRGRWIKDTPRTRRQILSGVQDWQGFSDSNPVDGIYAAIHGYSSKVNKLSLYVMGDDFSGSVQNALEQVQALRKDTGNKKIRVHAVGFFTPGVPETGFFHFARLTDLTRRNSGTFIGISTQ